MTIAGAEQIATGIVGRARDPHRLVTEITAALVDADQQARRRVGNWAVITAPAAAPRPAPRSPGS